MTNDQLQPVLLVFLKYPSPGKVKTRLAAELGRERAAALYRDWIGRILRTIQPLRPAVRVVGYFDGAVMAAFADWHSFVDEWRPQPDGDLGSRLAAGFEWAHSFGGPVIGMGTDCLDLDDSHVAAALAALGRVDVVFGPAMDGGYYLIGTRRNIPGFFDAVRWSSPHALADHRARCDQLGLSVTLLAELADIDTAADWRAYEARRR